VFLRRLLLAVVLSTAMLGLTTQAGSAAPAGGSPSVSPYVVTSSYTNAMYADCRTEGERCSWCPRGYSCAVVNAAPNSNLSDSVFSFRHCRTYAVSNWRGTGTFTNNQTGGARTYLYDRGHHLLTSVPADSRLHLYDFDPVWYVKAC
jgi:hypothetical protein